MYSILGMKPVYYTEALNRKLLSKSVSISIPVSSNEVNSDEISHVSSTSPLYTRNHNNQSGDSNNENDGVVLVHGGWTQETLSLLKKFAFGVMNPHDKYVEQLNKFFLISCLFAIFIDPLFFYLLSVKKDYKCVVINWPMAIILVVSRSITDFIYLMRILMEFKLAFISPESRVVGAGDLVKHHTKIALHYLSGFFFLDLLIVLPIPQMIVLFVQPNGVSSPGASYAKFLLQTVILIQYIPRLYRFLPLLGGQSSSGFIFQSTWANFVINLLTFVLAGHVIGSCWYMLGLLRVNRCLRDSCHDSRIMDCKKFIDCGHGNDYVYRGFEAVNLTTESSFITRYVYSSFWGLQQISTLGGNQTPSYFVGEVLFTMGIIGLGLLLFALLIGNMQNFLQGLGRRRLEKSLRRRDVEEWMSHRRLPDMIRREVRESERYHWAATRGVDEETLMENLPEDLQRDIRRHLFKFVKKVKIFALLDEPILDAICERLRQKTYIKGCTILYEGGFVTKMTFIVRGKMESIEKNGNNKVSLLEGDVCGEELLKWCLEDKRNQRKQGNRLLSNRTVKCLKDVEAFVLRAEDLEEVITLFDGFLKNVRVQFAIGNKSPYWQGVAASTIQIVVVVEYFQVIGLFVGNEILTKTNF
ncbi:unnamed protein product [Lactuca saligna]|uniref:Cyclic nucleotide-binding domain-containing protein n=1 Tax=Lactuca saligna TaxID=75948 RepID=A0AA35VL26_LACSI|nr:unnamed protein product [Lactuca saligna]